MENNKTDKIRQLIKDKPQRKHFFRKLASTGNAFAWLQPLEDWGYFDTKKKEFQDNKRLVLEYLENVANLNAEKASNEITSQLLKIIDSISQYKHYTKEDEGIDYDYFDWTIIKIIFKLSLEYIGEKHIDFIGEALRSSWSASLVSGDIGKIVLPKLINKNSKNLLLRCINIILEYKKIDNSPFGEKYTSVMDQYWLGEALERNKTPIAELCGPEAADIGLRIMDEITKKDKSTFNVVRIPTIEESEQSQHSEGYEWQLVIFMREMLDGSDAKQIEGKAKRLLNKKHPIFKRLGFHVIDHHYDELKNLFWNYRGNPLKAPTAKHEVYTLLKNHCKSFVKGEVDQVLKWIELREYYVPEHIRKDKDRREEGIACAKKEWLSAIVESKDPDVMDAYNKYQQINPVQLDHPGYEVYMEGGWVGSKSPIEKEKLNKMTNKEVVDFLNEYKGGNNAWNKPSKEGLANVFHSSVLEVPGKYTQDMNLFLDVSRLYQYKLLSGLCGAWHDKRDFSWGVVFDFIIQICDTEEFWKEDYPKVGYNYRDWIISQIAELIREGTSDEGHAFAAEFMPQAEKILLILAEKTESNLSEVNDLITSVLNSTKGSLFSAMINYSLRHARLCSKVKQERWPNRIKQDFEKRLDRDIEASLEFSVTLGKYLSQLVYLDKKWVTDNINRLFPKENEEHWKAAFSGYLFYSRQIYERIYKLLRENGHYEKALKVEFDSAHIEEKLVQHICVSYIEGTETLEDEKSLIRYIIEGRKISQLREIIQFLWGLHDNITDKAKKKIKPLWKKLFSIFSEDANNNDFQILLSNLSKWLVLIDKIDDNVFEWLRLSAKYVEVNHDGSLFVRYLLKHASRTPEKVGEIYCAMLEEKVYPDYKKEEIQKIVEVLYDKSQKIYANKICNMYLARGYDFLRDIFDLHNM